MGEEYSFQTEPRGDDEIRLTWVRGDNRPDPLDFWIIPANELEQAKQRVCDGEFDEGD